MLYLFSFARNSLVFYVAKQTLFIWDHANKILEKIIVNDITIAYKICAYFKRIWIVSSKPNKTSFLSVTA